MKRGINLRLPKKKASEASRRFVLFSVVAFAMTMIVGISIVGYTLFLNNKLKNLTAQREELRTQILSQGPKLYKLNDTHKRLDNIKSIVAGRLKVIDKIDDVANILPDGSKVMTIETKNLDVNYEINSPELGAINDMLENKVVALTLEKDKKVRSVELNSLVLNPVDKIYEVNFNVNF